jgi:hypothetical protein
VSIRFPFAFGLLGGGGFQLAFADAVRRALHDGDVGVGGEAVEYSGEGGGVGEDGALLLEALISGQQDRIVFVTVVDDLEEQVGSVRVIGQIADFVDTEQSRAGAVRPRRGGAG